MEFAVWLYFLGGRRATPEQEAAGLVMDPPVAGGEDPTALRCVLAVPGRHHPARAFDDRGERDDVVGLEIGLDHEVDEAGGERAIGVAVAAVARSPPASSTS